MIVEYLEVLLNHANSLKIPDKYRLKGTDAIGLQWETEVEDHEDLADSGSDELRSIWAPGFQREFPLWAVGPGRSSLRFG